MLKALRHRLALLRMAFARDLYVVLWWPVGDEPVPEVMGPFTSGDRALEVRNSIRRRQRRELNMAQATYLPR